MPKTNWGITDGMSSKWVMVDFKPVAEPGWRVVEALLADESDDDDEQRLDVQTFPLAGWAILSRSIDAEEPNAERDAVPAYWGNDESVGLQYFPRQRTATGRGGREVLYLLAPGQEPQREAKMLADIERPWGDGS